MKVNVSREGQYIPEWKCNRDEPGAEQIIVNYKHLSYDERAKHESKKNPMIRLTEFDLEKKGRMDKAVSAQHASYEMEIESESAVKIAKAMDPTIEHLEDEDGNPIDTWAKLLAIPQNDKNAIAELIVEIRTALVGAAMEKDSKNSA